MLGSGELYVWGRNDRGQLGNSDLNDTSWPDKMRIPQEPISLFLCQGFCTCIVFCNGVVKTVANVRSIWKNNVYGSWTVW